MARRDSGGYLSAALAELYDPVYGSLGREDRQFFIDEAVAAGGPVLELGCGTGRVLLPTARAGVAVTGLDLSEPMLAVLRRKLEREREGVRQRVTVVQGDMRRFDLGRQFALITIPFRPFQHLITVEEQMACLRCARRHLANAGKLVFDTFQVDFRKIADKARCEETEDLAGLELPDGRKVRRTHRFAATHKAEQYSDVEIIYYITHPDGREERVVHAFPFRYFFRYEVEHLLALCGYRVAALYGDFDRSPLGDESPQMIFVAEKAEEAGPG